MTDNIIERPVPREVFIDVPYDVYVERPVENIIEKEVHFDRIVEVPVYHERIVEVPVEAIVEKRVPVYIEKFIEYPVYMDKIAEVPVQRKGLQYQPQNSANSSSPQKMRNSQICKIRIKIHLIKSILLY